MTALYIGKPDKNQIRLSPGSSGPTVLPLNAPLQGFQSVLERKVVRFK
jgi:hypothetical protein